MVAGVDEVGRGPLAGPVVAAAVILLRPLEGLADSKVLCAHERERLAGLLRARARIGIGAASVAEIDRINILQASLLAMRRAVMRLGCLPELALVDGNKAPDLPCPVQTIVDGDALVPAISAASIVAKVTRDRLMRRLAARYPGTAGTPTSATPPARTARRSGSLASAATTGAASPRSRGVCSTGLQPPELPAARLCYQPGEPRTYRVGPATFLHVLACMSFSSSAMTSPALPDSAFDRSRIDREGADRRLATTVHGVAACRNSPMPVATRSSNMASLPRGATSESPTGPVAMRPSGRLT